MTNFNLEEAKSKLGEQTEKFERKVSDLWGEYSSNYTDLEPWKRGLVLIGILVILILVAYYLLHENKNKAAIKKAQAEAVLEEKIIKRMELLKKLRE